MKVVLLRNSERRSYLRCRLRWWWEWVEKRKPKHTHSALTFGDLTHQSLEKYYKKGRERGPHPAKTFLKVYDKLTLKLGYNLGMKIKDEEDEEMTWHRFRDLGVAMLTSYVEHYGPEDHIEILVPEMPFKVKLYNPKNNKYVVTAVGKLDAVYRDHSILSKPLGIIDHKTAASIQTAYLSLDEQGSTYFALAPLYLRSIGLLGEDERLRHILFNFLRKAMPDERPFRYVKKKKMYLNKPTKKHPEGEISARQPAKYFVRHEVIKDEADSINMIQRIVMQAWEMKQVKKGVLPIYKNPQRDCAATCGFHAICELHESDGDWEEALELMTKPWNPLADHELTKKE